MSAIGTLDRGGARGTAVRSDLSLTYTYPLSPPLASEGSAGECTVCGGETDGDNICAECLAALLNARAHERV